MIPALATAKAALIAGRAWVWVACAIALIALGFYGGATWRKGQTEAAKRARDNQANVAKAWKDRAEGFELAVKGFQDTQAANDKADEERREQAERILADLNAKKRKADAEQAQWKANFERAKRNPNCAELLKETTCSVFKSY